jgi:hypothetical protein
VGWVLGHVQLDNIQLIRVLYLLKSACHGGRSFGEIFFFPPCGQCVRHKILLPIASKLAVGATQPPIQWVPGGFFPRG